jgi:hypothetical protein
VFLAYGDAMTTTTAPPRTAAATLARKQNARRRRLRAAAELLRAEGFKIDPPNLDAALLISEE